MEVANPETKRELFFITSTVDRDYIFPIVPEKSTAVLCLVFNKVQSEFNKLNI